VQVTTRAVNPFGLATRNSSTIRTSSPSSRLQSPHLFRRRLSRRRRRGETLGLAEQSPRGSHCGSLSGDGVRRRLSRRPPRRRAAREPAAPSTSLAAAITAVYSGWFCTRVCVVVCALRV